VALGFEHTRTWLADVREHADPQLSCILVGNKIDLCGEDPDDVASDAAPSASANSDAASTPTPASAPAAPKAVGGKPRAVPRAEAAAWAESEGLLFVEASAKNGANVEKAFADACRDVLRKVRAGAFEDGRVSLLLYLGR
jgi:Ras-related protein Rab-2A